MVPDDKKGASDTNEQIVVYLDKEQTAGYLAQEHQNLHDDLMRRFDRQTTIETYAVVASAAIYSFALATEINKAYANLSVLLWWLPILITFLAHSRWLHNRNVIDRIGDYIRGHYEPAVKLHHVGFKGWHSFFTPIAHKEDEHKLVTPYSIWYYIYLANIAAAIFATGYVAISTQADEKSCLGSLGSWLTENF